MELAFNGVREAMVKEEEEEKLKKKKFDVYVCRKEKQRNFILFLFSNLLIVQNIIYKGK